MTKIEELRELLKKATPGPWEAENVVYGNGSRSTGIYRMAVLRDTGRKVQATTVCHVPRFSDATPSDAWLIEAMHAALPALLDVAQAAEIVVAGARRPDAVKPADWYTAIDMMRDALAKITCPNVIGGEK